MHLGVGDPVRGQRGVHQVAAYAAQLVDGDGPALKVGQGPDVCAGRGNDLVRMRADPALVNRPFAGAMYGPVGASAAPTAPTRSGFSGPAGLPGPAWSPHAAVAIAIPATVIPATARRQGRRPWLVNVAARRLAGSAQPARPAVTRAACAPVTRAAWPAATGSAWPAAALPVLGDPGPARSPGSVALEDVSRMRASLGDADDGRRRRHRLRRIPAISAEAQVAFLSQP